MRKALMLLALTSLVLGLALVGFASGGNRTVKADDFDFEPGRVTIDVGDKVTWRNVEGRHTVTLRNGKYDKVIDGDDKVSRKFRNAGTFRYYCRFHTAQGMKGKVIVE
jgi:plastocyanin